jgi:hypothetical protein
MTITQIGNKAWEYTTAAVYTVGIAILAVIGVILAIGAIIGLLTIIAFIWLMGLFVTLCVTTYGVLSTDREIALVAMILIVAIVIFA